MTLLDYNGTELIANFTQFKSMIVEHMEPSEPYLVSLDAVRGELAQSQVGI